MTDFLAQLPTDSNPVTYNEQKILENIFRENPSVLKYDMKEYILAGSLFAVFSLPQTDSLIKNFIKAANNIYILIAIKSVAFVVLYFFLKNINLIKSS